MTNYVKRISMYFFACYMFSLVKYLFTSFTHLLLGYLFSHY